MSSSSSPQSMPINGKPRTFSNQFGNPHATASQLATPNGTPPTSAAHVPQPTPFSESRLQQLLAHFDSGTHEIDRAERESALERKMSFGDALPTPPRSEPSSRRPSFLASLSLTRFSSNTNTDPTSNPSSSSSTPVHTPISAKHPHLPSSLQMTSSSSSPQRPDIIERPKSTPTVPSNANPASSSSVAANLEALKSSTVPPPNDNSPISPTEGGGAQMQRSNTMPHVPKTSQPGGPGGMGFAFLHRKASMGQGVGARPSMSSMGMTGLTPVDINQEEKRHFDPSKEPRLLGLL